MQKIPLLSGGKILAYALVDDADAAWLSAFPWRLMTKVKPHGLSYYAVRSIHNKNTLMHRFILGLTIGDKRIVDHKDGNGLNNQRDNIRIATGLQNNANRRHFQSDRLKGTLFCPSMATRKWCGLIKNKGKSIRLGCRGEGRAGCRQGRWS